MVRGRINQNIVSQTIYYLSADVNGLFFSNCNVTRLLKPPLPEQIKTNIFYYNHDIKYI